MAVRRPRDRTSIVQRSHPAGDERALKRVPIYDGNEVVGSHEACLLCDDTLLALTSLRDGKGAMREHLARFLTHSNDVFAVGEL